MVNWSEEVVLPTEIVIVITVELVITSVAEVISRPTRKEIFGVREVLNSKPAGAFNNSVCAVPELKSLLFPSAMTMGPRLVQAGEVALAALSAEIFEPLLAAVIVTDASAEVVLKQSPTRSHRTI